MFYAEPSYIKLYLQDILYLSDIPNKHTQVLYELLKRSTYAGDKDGMQVIVNSYVKNCSELLPTFALHALRGGSFDPKISCFSLTRSQIYRTISDRPNLTNNSVQRANPGVPTGFVQSDSI